ncbi:MAG: hypothetical protein IKF11_04235, partial [Methanobrevibacter sp.]|nr:hypothetical protein [Methanobrevibacter sp.]
TVFNNKTGLIVFNRDDFDQSQFNIGNLTVGCYNITISNIENDNYTEYTTSSLFIINKAQSFVNITEIINGVYNTTNATVKFNIINQTSVQISIFNNKTNECVYNNTNFDNDIISLANLTASTYKIIINNIENDYYESSYNSTLFSIIKANSRIEITNVINSTFNTTNVEISMNIMNKTTVTIIISQKNNVIYTINNFQDNLFVIGNLTAGKYNITITNDENDNYNSSSNISTFSVLKANSSINIINVVNSTYKINSTIATINVVNKTSISYIVKNHKGIEILSGNASNNEIIINDLGVGEYSITVFNNENNNYLPSNSSALFNVVKSHSKVNIISIENGTYNIQNATVKFNIIAPTIVNITVRDMDGEIVYANTNYDGNIFSISSLLPGIYNISVLNMETEDAYSSNDSALFKVVVQTSIIATDMNRGYNSPYDYFAIFTDEFGNKLNNITISMIIDGKQYNLTTDENGNVYLNTTTLSVGIHNIQLVNTLTGEITNHTTKIVERLQENKDIVMDFCDGTHYRVRAYGDDAKPISGVIVKITINGITYDVKTDKNGYASLIIRLNPDKFKITAEWKDFKINKVVVRQTLKAKSVTARKSAKYTKYSATLKWSNGKAIVGKKITFKFRGKTYTAKTNKKGVATIKIKKSVFNKLRVGKKYKISITYKNIDKGYASINNISKTIKIRK